MQALILLNSLQSGGGFIAEHLHPRVGYPVCLAVGFSVQWRMFGVFCMGLISTYRAIREP
jgi:hypothetical protein